MDSRPSPASPFDAWLAALDERHLADFRPAEVGRALRALSSCYVERRSRLAEGGALETAGKRAAFALFYAPLHFLTADRVVSALPSPAPVTEVLDLGCGTGAAGAAWALQCAAGRISGFDRHPWAVAEANWTYRVLGLQGRAYRQDLSRVRLEPGPGLGILAAYTINELPDDLRSAWLTRAARRARARRHRPRHRTHRPEDGAVVARLGGPVPCRRRKVRRMALRCPAARSAAATGPIRRPQSA